MILYLICSPRKSIFPGANTWPLLIIFSINTPMIIEILLISDWSRITSNPAIIGLITVFDAILTVFVWKSDVK